MTLDPDAVCAAVRELRELPADSGGAQYDAMNGVLGPLVEAHGVDAVIEALAPHRSDPDVAEALFFLFWTEDRRITELWTDDEVVDAALTYFRAFAMGDHGTGRALGPPGHWGWQAISQHVFYGQVDHLTDEEHFRMLVQLLEQVPPDDQVLWMIGDGPMCHAGANAEYLNKLETLATTNPNIARAYELLDEEWQRRNHP